MNVSTLAFFSIKARVIQSSNVYLCVDTWWRLAGGRVIQCSTYMRTHEVSQASGYSLKDLPHPQAEHQQQ